MATPSTKSTLGEVLLKNTLQPVMRKTLLELLGPDLDLDAVRKEVAALQRQLQEEVQKEQKQRQEKLQQEQERHQEQLKQEQERSLKQLKEEQEQERKKLQLRSKEQQLLLARLKEELEEVGKQRELIGDLNLELGKVRRELESYHEDVYTRREDLLSDRRWRWRLRFVLVILPNLRQIIARDDLYLIFGNLPSSVCEDLFDRVTTAPDDEAVRLILAEFEVLPSRERESILEWCKQLCKHYKKIKVHPAASSLLA